MTKAEASHAYYIRHRDAYSEYQKLRNIMRIGFRSRACEHCHKEFEYRFKGSGQPPRRFCSHECYADHMVIWMTCNECGTQFRAKRGGSRNKRFCSCRCFGKWNSRRKVTKQARRAMALAKIGKTPEWTKDKKKALSAIEKRRKTTNNWAGLSRRGKDHWHWRGGKDTWPERNRANSRKMRHMRRAAMANCKGRFTQEQIDRKLKNQNGKCVYYGINKRCKGDIERSYTIDHRKPLSRGGGNSIANIDLTCNTCNTMKGRKTVKEFLLYLRK